MPNRIIKESICTSDNLDQLSPQEESFFFRLIVNCDDYGIMDARPKILLAKCYPLRVGKIKEVDINKWLKALINAELCYLYEVNGRRYLKMTSWENHQQIRAHKSKYPTPDSDGFQMISDDIRCPRNPIQSNPNPIQSEGVKLLFDFWNEQGIIVHKELTKPIISAIEKALKEHTTEEIQSSILHYNQMLNDNTYEYCSYKWTLINFLGREKGYQAFMDDGEKWINYQNRIKPSPSSPIIPILS